MPKRVLIAEDHEQIRSLIRSQVERIPGVDVCASVADGLAAATQAFALRPDVLILDVLMPKLTGIEVAGVLKDGLPDAKIILFTLNADTISPQTINALGVTVVSKTDGFQALRRTLQEVFGSRAREVDEGLARAINNRLIDTAGLDALTRQFSVPLTRCGRDLKYLWVNEYYANFMRSSVGKIAGRPIVDILGKAAVDVLGKYFDQVLRGEVVSYDVEVEIASVGLRRLTASYRPTFAADGACDGWLAYVEHIVPNVRRVSGPRSEIVQAS